MTTEQIEEMQDQITESGSLTGNVSPDIERGSDSVKRKSDVEKWEQIKNDCLIEWGAHPEYFEVEGEEPPSEELITYLIKLTHKLKNEGTLPDRVVPDTDGGISFVYESDNVRIRVDFRPDFSVETLKFRNNELISRETLTDDLRIT